MKRILAALCCMILAGVVFAEPKVFISQVVEHPALDITTKGIIDALEKLGYKNGENLDLRIESAQGSSVLAAQIANKFVNQDPDIVVGVGTMSAQSFIKYAHNNKVKLIFSSVTDPIGASLINSLAKPGNNTSGVSNFVKLEPQLEVFKRLQPKLQRLGIIYNPGEANSISIIKKLEVICPSMNITLIKQAAHKTADVAQAAIKLSSQVDAILIHNDSTALSAMQSIIRAANIAKIPVYVSDTAFAKSGALATIGPDQYTVGQQTGKIIAQVLKGKDAGTIPVEFPSKTDLFINSEVAKILGIEIPNDLRAINNGY